MPFLRKIDQFLLNSSVFSYFWNEHIAKQKSTNSILTENSLCINRAAVLLKCDLAMSGRFSTRIVHMFYVFIQCSRHRSLQLNQACLPHGAIKLN